MAVGLFFKRREFVFSMDINRGSTFEPPSTRSDLSGPCRFATEDRGGAGWGTQPNKPELIGHLEKRDFAIAGTAQNRSRIKRAPTFLRRTVPTPDPILLAEEPLPEETGSRRGAEAVRSAPPRPAPPHPTPPWAAFGLRPGFSVKPQNLRRERRIGRI
jgi:hypothetical protein